jgi:quercetin dioxygenase-like cupin family protein
MTRGWFIGNFEPAALRSEAAEVAEVAVQQYGPGDYEARHYHNVATEVTLIVSGEVEMNHVRYRAGDIVVIEPGEATDFRALSNVVTVAVKLPSVKHDKYVQGGV